MLTRNLVALAASLLMIVTLAGCAPSAADEAAKQAAADENEWAAMGYEGDPPAHDAATVKEVISSIADRSNSILIDGSSDADCVAYEDAFKGLLLAEFDDPRDDYIAPLSNSISQVISGCRDRGTWEGTIDDVVDVATLGDEYVSKF